MGELTREIKVSIPEGKNPKSLLETVHTVPEYQ